MNPTTEQQAAIDLFAKGEGLAIEAGAGCGKTSVLKMLAESTQQRGQYVAFNRAIVDEAARKMPANVSANTMHSIAYRAKGVNFKERLGAKRVPSSQLARILGVDPLTVKAFDGKPKTLSAGYLASLAMKAITNFCNTADLYPAAKHVPFIEGLDEIGSNGRRTYVQNNIVSDYLEKYLDRAWDDMLVETGNPFTHDAYLKMFELDAPKIHSEFILFDEGQDASGVMTSIVFQQTDSQIVVVGDSQQAIYGWRGAVDAIDKFRQQGCNHATLSQSFRFGQAIADTANVVLDALDAELRLTGTPTIESRIDYAPLPTANALLTRTNAKSVERLLAMQAEGRKVHLMGGGKEVLSFARAAADLQAGKWTGHADLGMFDTWDAVEDYVENDPAGDELKLLVGLVDQFGANEIATALSAMPTEDKADLVITTAHRAKGREWSTVVLGDDFPNPEKREISDEELRLVYVAATRAQQVLDPYGCLPLMELLTAQDEPEGTLA